MQYIVFENVNDYLIGGCAYYSRREVMRDILYVENASFATANKNSIVVRNIISKEKLYFPFESITCIIFDHPKSYYSTRLITTCLKEDILLIFCDEKHAPMTSVHREYGYVRKLKKLRQQMKQSQRSKDRIWQKVIKQKIANQNLCLEILNVLAAKKYHLEGIMNDVRLGDQTNRESLASRLYFKGIFGDDFKRFNDDVINAGLNYVYAIIRSVIRQNLVRLGLEPALGIHHASEENPFNLSDDIIECFRPIADEFVYDKIIRSEVEEFSLDVKKQLPQILLERCVIDGKVYYLSDAIRISCESFNQCIEKDNATGLKLPIMIEGGR